MRVRPRLRLELPFFGEFPTSIFAVSTAIDRGVPVMNTSNTEIARSFTGLATLLTKDDLEVKRSAWSLFKTV